MFIQQREFKKQHDEQVTNLQINYFEELNMSHRIFGDALDFVRISTPQIILLT